MLVKLDGNWVDPGLVEFVYEPSFDDTGTGGICSYRGEPGFVRFDAEDDRPVLINARCVVRLRLEDEVVTEIETHRGERVLVKGGPDWVATCLNRVRRVGLVA
jgi:hypothetical protein